jgi:hypothetical protein
VVEGSMTKETFLQYLEFIVVSCSIAILVWWFAVDFLASCPSAQPSQVLWVSLSWFMDNTKIHHGDDVTDLVKAFGEHFICLSTIFSNLTAFRCADWIPSPILTRSQPHWRGIL